MVSLRTLVLLSCRVKKMDNINDLHDTTDIFNSRRQGERLGGIKSHHHFAMGRQ